VFIGVNDLGISHGRFEGPMAEMMKAARAASSPATAETMIAGYRQLIARARARGLKVLGATITPYGSAFYYSEEGEAVRQAINTWIRTSKEVDGVLDFDAAIRDPARPTRMKDGFHSGDFLHGSDAGYAAMAAVIDPGLLK
jgi:lysophospholipase L1-like esterase